MAGTTTDTQTPPDGPPFAVDVRSRGEGTSTVAVSGEVDVATSPALRAVLLDPEQCPGPELVLDLRAVTFLDSSGLSVLVATHNALAERDGRIRLECHPGPVPLVLRACGLDQVLEVLVEGEEA